MKVLIVDDSRQDSELIERILTRAGYECRVAESATRGLEYFEEFEPDLVLMDIFMPYLNGIGALREIKKRDRETGRKTRVIVVSSGDMEDIRDALQAGADGFVRKPVDQSELMAKVAGSN